MAAEKQQMFFSLCCSSSCSPSICFIWPFEHLHNLHSSDTRLLLSVDVGVEKGGGGMEPYGLPGF